MCGKLNIVDYAIVSQPFVGLFYHVGGRYSKGDFAIKKHFWRRNLGTPLCMCVEQVACMQLVATVPPTIILLRVLAFQIKTVF